MERPRLLRRSALFGAAVASAGVLAGSASAAYWDWSGNMGQGTAYVEAGGAGGPQTWQIRLSRELCGTKMELWGPGVGWFRVPIPGGCSNHDYTYPYDSQVYHEASCYNADGPTMWVNCRVDPNM